MRNTPALFSTVLLSVFFCMMSCIKDADLEHAENRSQIEVFKTNIISFDKQMSSFLDVNDANRITVSDTIHIGNTISKYADGNLIKADFLVEVTNSTNHAYQVEFDFLNHDHELLYTISFGVAASTNNRNIVFEYDEVFEGLELELIKATKTIISNLNLIPSDDNTLYSALGKLKLK